MPDAGKVMPVMKEALKPLRVQREFRLIGPREPLFCDEGRAEVGAPFLECLEKVLRSPGRDRLQDPGIERRLNLDPASRTLGRVELPDQIRADLLPIRRAR
jgi:hypothetical protein